MISVARSATGIALCRRETRLGRSRPRSGISPTVGIYFANRHESRCIATALSVDLLPVLLYQRRSARSPNGKAKAVDGIEQSPIPLPAIQARWSDEPAAFIARSEQHLG